MLDEEILSELAGKFTLLNILQIFEFPSENGARIINSKNWILCKIDWLNGFFMHMFTCIIRRVTD